MLKALVIGDPHFRRDNARETIMLTERCVTLVKHDKPDFVVVLGDTLHNHERCDLMSMNRAYDFLNAMSSLVHTYVLIGNHDILNNSCFQTQYHAFNPLKKWTNITIVDRAVSTNIKGSNFCFVPYVEPGRFVEALNTINVPLDQNTLHAVPLNNINTTDIYGYLISFFGTAALDICEYAEITKPINHWSTSTAIFCHQEFYGAKTGVIKSIKGDHWPVGYPQVISGHIHEYDRLSANILYTGTPAQYTFGETAHKTVSMITFNGPTGMVMPVGYTEQRIDLHIPKKLTYKLTPSEVATFAIPESQDTVRCIIEGKRIDISSIRGSKKIKDWERQGVKIKYIELSDLSEDIKLPAPIPKNKSYQDVLFEACKAEGINDLYQEIFGVAGGTRLILALPGKFLGNMKIHYTD
jgi:DNA repair exonuclease SbcCD nuclease subunit